MFIFLFTIITLSIGVSLVTTRSPIALGLWILILSIFVSILCGSMLFSWFGFIIFLIYIGGILVIFAYFAAIQPNQQFRLSTPVFFAVLSALNLPINIYPVTVNIFTVESWWVSSIFYISNIFTIIILGFVLFLALIRVVKITIINVAPLRPYLYV